MIAESKAGCWLCFDSTLSLSSKEIREYEVKGPLYAASAILSREKTSSDRLLVEAELEARIPFQKRKHFQVRSETDLRGEVVFEESNTANFSVLSAAGLVFAINDSYRSPTFTSGHAFFVLNKKLFAIRTDRLSAHQIEIEIVSVLDQAPKIENIDWTSAHSALCDWKNEIESLSFKAPFLGNVKINRR